MPAGTDIDRLASARVGQTLRGKLRLDSLLGVGGTAAVYAATHRTGRRYAVKILHPQWTLDASIRQRFFREGYVVNRIAHPGVVGIVDDDVDEHGALFLVMELLEGRTVDALAEAFDGRLPVGDVLSIADHALDVLKVAHASGIVHRDIKPDNMFVTRDGHVKVLDFGIARLLELGGRTPLTRAGTIMGTPAFMPPEQARGRLEAIDARSDLWSVGATMFSLLTGRMVHHAETANELLLAAMKAHAPKLRDALPEASAEVAGLVDRALSYERDARWPSAAAMQDAVRAARRTNPAATLVRDIAFDPDLTMPLDPAGFEETVAAPMKTAGVNPFDATVLPGSRLLVRPSGGGDDASAFLQRSAARAGSGDVTGALEDLAQALTLDPSCSVAHFNRGLLHQRGGDDARAVEDYGAALAIDPSLAEAHENRARCLQRLGDIPAARQDAASACAIYDAQNRKREAEAARLLGQALSRFDNVVR